jgi:Spy/CpxP family protein refolding chaperone
MKIVMIVPCMMLALSVPLAAQGRGGRQGGPGGPGSSPPGPLCLNRADVQTLDMTVRPARYVNGAVNAAGDVPVNVVTITGKPGVNQVLNPCPAGLGGDDPLAQFFFAPDLIMSHQQQIGLTSAQRASVTQAVVHAQGAFVPAQLAVAAEVEKLQKLSDAAVVDESAVLAEVDRLLALERDIKREQLTLMIRLKNLLTQPQRDALSKLRNDEQ